MNSVIDKLSLQGVLRQLLCGAVFFASIGLLLPHEVAKLLDFIHAKDAIMLLAGGATILSLTIGTLIYHLEKNFYSYFIQILLGRKKNIEANKFDVKVLSQDGAVSESLLVYVPVIDPGEQVAIQGVAAAESAKSKPSLLVFWWALISALLSLTGIVYELYVLLERKLLDFPLITIIVFVSAFALLLITTILLLCHQERVVTETRSLWLAEAWGKDIKAEGVIMQRVANWSDFIHCGQCCAFAWMLGSLCVLCYCLRYEPSNVPYVRIKLGFLCSLLLLFLELIADWHRYHHVLYVLNSKASNPSSSADDKLTGSLPSTSNPKN